MPVEKPAHVTHRARTSKGAMLSFAIMCRSRPVPVGLIFNPNWWFRNYGISFEQPFYLDRRQRIQNDVSMRRALYERFGLGEPDPQPRPVIGSMHIAGGFVLPALFGVPIRFLENQAAWPLPLNLSREQILALRPPDIERTWPMNQIIADMDALEKEFGYVIGDLNTAGLINTGLELRGQELFIDMLEAPDVVEHLFSVIAQTQASVARYIQSRTGSSSVAVNCSISAVDPRIYLHSNCSVQMISPQLYQRALLTHECRLAEELRPYGIHHCGKNLHLYATAYASTRAVFYDVGWGSNVAKCSQLLPDAFLNLRLSPVRMLQEPAAAICADVSELLAAAGRRENVGICCINMDHGTPDENVNAVLSVAR
jgi:hypothetical protein